MATLIVELHCMCLFVPDTATGSVHVLMPSMHGPGGHHNHGNGHAAHDNGHVGSPPPSDKDAGSTDGGTGSDVPATNPGNGGGGNGSVPEKHVVRMLHDSFKHEPLGRSMEGWALILDDGTGPANLRVGPLKGMEIPDLTEVCGEKVKPELVSILSAQGMTSRVTFRAGKATKIHSNGFEWELGGIKNRVLGHAVSWTIPNVPDQLTWVRIGATQPPPILSLRELETDTPDVYRIRIHHESERTLGKPPMLKAQEVRKHFAAFYAALGLGLLDEADAKNKELFPDLEGAGGGTVMCRSAQAQLA